MKELKDRLDSLRDEQKFNDELLWNEYSQNQEIRKAIDVEQKYHADLREKVNSLSETVRDTRSLSIAQGVLLEKFTEEDLKCKEKIEQTQHEYERSEADLREALLLNIAALKEAFAEKIQEIDDDVAVKKLMIKRKLDKLSSMKEEVTDGKFVPPLDTVAREYTSLMQTARPRRKSLLSEDCYFED